MYIQVLILARDGGVFWLFLNTTEHSLITGRNRVAVTDDPFI